MRLFQWEMTHQAWVQRVDALVIATAKGLRFALEGRTATREHAGLGVRASALIRPTWRTIAGSIMIDDQGADRQVYALFSKPNIEPNVSALCTYNEHRTRFYDRDNLGASRAAIEITAFLVDGVLPDSR